MLKDAPTGSAGTACPSGWMTADTLSEFLQHFVAFVSCNPVLMPLDNHKSHASTPGTDFSKKKRIVIVTFPPHTSHRLQPLDCSVYTF